VAFEDGPDSNIQVKIPADVRSRYEHENMTGATLTGEDEACWPVFLVKSSQEGSALHVIATCLYRDKKKLK